MDNANLELPLDKHNVRWNLDHFPERLCTTDSLREFLNVFTKWITETADEFEAILGGK